MGDSRMIDEETRRAWAKEGKVTLSSMDVGERGILKGREFTVYERYAEDRASGSTHIRYAEGGIATFVWDSSNPIVQRIEGLFEGEKQKAAKCFSAIERTILSSEILLGDVRVNIRSYDRVITATYKPEEMIEFANGLLINAKEALRLRGSKT